MRSHPCYSSLTTYLQCPAAFAIGYRNRDPGISVEAMENGCNNHDGIRRYAEYCHTNKRKCDTQDGMRIAAGYQEPTRSLLEKFVTDWRWDWGSTVVEGVAPVEQHLKAMLPGGQEFSGHLDLLQRYEGAGSVEADPFGENDTGDGDDSLWVITDWKSGLYGDFSDTEAPKQLQWYAWLAQQNYPAAKCFELRLHILRGFGWTPGPWRLGGDLSYIGYELQALCDRIAADEECEPHPGEACLKCTYVHACPCKDTATLEAICGDTAEGRARKALWHDAQSAALKVLLKAQAKADGPIPVDRMVYEGHADKLLVAKSPATLDTDLAPFGLTRNDLTNGVTKGQIENAAKTIADEQQAAFMDLWELRFGTVKYGFYKQAQGGDSDE